MQGPAEINSWVAPNKKKASGVMAPNALSIIDTNLNYVVFAW